MRLTLHLTREQRIRLEQAAALCGVPLNDFIVDRACAAADKALSRRNPEATPSGQQYALRLENQEKPAPTAADAREAEQRRSLWDDADRS